MLVALPLHFALLLLRGGTDEPRLKINLFPAVESLTLDHAPSILFPLLAPLYTRARARSQLSPILLFPI